MAYLVYYTHIHTQQMYLHTQQMYLHTQTHTHTANAHYITYIADVLTLDSQQMYLHHRHSKCTYITDTANVLTSQTYKVNVLTSQINTTNVLTECFCFVSRPDATIYNFLCKIF